MKVLLDECLPLDFRHSFPEYQVHSTQWAGLKGKKNGALLQAAEELGYNVLLTVDQGMPYQQNLKGRALAAITIRSTTNQLEDLLLFVPKIIATVQQIKPGETLTVT